MNRKPKRLTEPPPITLESIQKQMESPCTRCGEPIGTRPHYLTHDGLAHADCEEEHFRQLAQARSRAAAG